MSRFLASDILIAVCCTQKEILICFKKHVSFDVAWRPKESAFIRRREFQENKSHFKTRNLTTQKNEHSQNEQRFFEEIAQQAERAIFGAAATRRASLFKCERLESLSHYRRRDCLAHRHAAQAVDFSKLPASAIEQQRSLRILQKQVESVFRRTEEDAVVVQNCNCKATEAPLTSGPS